MAERVAIILAAGQSTRMKTKVAKVLHEVCGRAMLDYVLDAFRQLGVAKMYLVVGYGKEQIISRYGGCDDIVFVEQAERKGTGHAVMCCKEHLAGFEGQCLVLCGDMPLIRAETLKKLVEKHDADGSAATLATSIMEDQFGYGRIVRDANGNIKGIVEENECTDEEKLITEVNPSYYCFDSPVLFEALESIRPDNSKGEYYLTDAIAVIIAGGKKISAVTAVSPEDAIGVNDRRQLGIISSIMRRRIQERLMAGGVTIVDPATTWIDGRAEIGVDTVIEPFTYIEGNVTVGENCRIGPFACLREGSDIEAGTVVSGENMKSFVGKDGK